MRILLIIFYVIISTSSTNSFAQNDNSILGYWNGKVQKRGVDQPVQIHFYKSNEKLMGRYTIRAQRIYDSPIALDSVNYPFFKINFGYGSFKMKLSDKNFMQSEWSEDSEMTIQLKRSGKSTKWNFTQEEIQFINKDVTLHGTLLRPKQKRFPIAVLVHGSGPSGRDEFDYRSQAFELAKNGIGVLFYDKRGCGKSTGDWEIASLTDLARDASAGMNYLKTRNEFSNNKIGFFGTSQGGWIIPIAANENPSIDFAVLNASPAVSSYQQYNDFLQYFMADKGVKQIYIDSLINFTKLYFKSLNAPSLRPQVLSLAKRIENGPEWWRNFLPAYDEKNVDWWSKNYYDPKKDLMAMQCPVLVLYGTSDEMVPAQTNADLMRVYLDRPSKLNTIKVFEGMEHSSEIEDAEIIDPATKEKKWVWRHTAPNFYETIIDWMKNL